jgi:hypothetical protein
MEGASCEYLALIRLAAGNAEAAELEARKAIIVASQPTPLPLNIAESLAILAQALLAQGRVPEALEAARDAHERLVALGGIDDGESIISLAWAEALSAAGDQAGARAAIAQAKSRLLERAAKILDPAARDGFLTRVPENARTLACAADWSA